MGGGVCVCVFVCVWAFGANVRGGECGSSLEAWSVFGVWVCAAFFGGSRECAQQVCVACVVFWKGVWAGAA